jgi:hypothetical protein
MTNVEQVENQINEFALLFYLYLTLNFFQLKIA